METQPTLKLTNQQVFDLLSKLDFWQYSSVDVPDPVNYGDLRFLELLRANPNMSPNISVIIARCRYDSERLYEQYGAFAHGVEVRLHHRIIVSDKKGLTPFPYERIDNPELYRNVFEGSEDFSTELERELHNRVKTVVDDIFTRYFSKQLGVLLK